MKPILLFLKNFFIVISAIILGFAVAFVLCILIYFLLKTGIVGFIILTVVIFSFYAIITAIRMTEDDLDKEKWEKEDNEWEEE